MEGLTAIETAVLISVARLSQGEHGVAIFEDVAMICGKKLTQAAVYAALGRLRRRQLVHRHRQPAQPMPGGKRKQLYTLTEDGLAMLEWEFRQWHRLWWTVPPGVTRGWLLRPDRSLHETRTRLTRPARR
jgi:PadR family transcriptional regulator, regulatory protein PadR